MCSVFLFPLERGRLNGTAAFHIRLIGQTRTVAIRRQDMCQCQQAVYEPYPYPAPTVSYDPYAYPAPPVSPLCVPNYVVPYPSLTVSYDPYWAGRLAPTTIPLKAISTEKPSARFRGEVLWGNWLLIYE